MTDTGPFGPAFQVESSRPDNGKETTPRGEKAMNWPAVLGAIGFGVVGTMIVAPHIIQTYLPNIRPEILAALALGAAFGNYVQAYLWKSTAKGNGSPPVAPPPAGPGAQP